MITAPVNLLSPLFRNEKYRVAIVIPISHHRENTVWLDRGLRPNTMTGSNIPNKTFMVLLLRDSLTTAMPSPSMASLTAVIVFGMPVKDAITSMPTIILLTPHASLKNTAERTIPILAKIMITSEGAAAQMPTL